MLLPSLLLLDFWTCPPPRSLFASAYRHRAFRSAEGEHVCLRAGVEERDLQRAIPDRAALADQLVQPGISYRAVAPFVDIDASRPVGRLAIDQLREASGT